VSTTADLSWSGGDPDAGDTVTYDVYFGTANPPTALLCNDAATPACDPGTLAYGAHYYWNVVATDNHGTSTTGPVWDFTTISTPQVGPLVYHRHTIDDDTSTSNGDNDGIVDCGETIELNATLFNQGDTTATGVSASLSTSDSYITVTDVVEDYPDILGGGTGEDIYDYDFEVASDMPDGHVIHFDLDISASNGGPWSDSFDVPVSCLTGVVVVLNEIDIGDSDAVELYNAGSQAVALDGWHLIAYDDHDAVDVDYVIPSGFTLQPGAYVVIHENSGTNNANELYTGSNIIWDPSNSGGAAALTNGISGVDFVRWGDAAVAPPAGTSWSGNEPGVPPSADIVLGRDGASTDTDDGGDWCAQTASLGSSNDACIVQDSYEPDGTWDQANTMVPGVSQTHSIWPVGDLDWITFDLGDRSEVIIETSGTSGNTRMWLYDEEMNQVEADDDDGDLLFSRIDRLCGVDALRPGTYYVKIDEYDGDDPILSYDVSLAVTPCLDVFCPLVISDP
jgi:hypothetical protein